MGTDVRLLARVSQQVGLQIGDVCKSFPALVALVGFLPGVNEHVVSKTRKVSERFATLCAFVGLLSSVC